jgi:hypothetical protein
MNTVADFWALVDVGDPAECWPWLGGTDRDGYGRFRLNGRRWRVPMLAHWLAFGRDTAKRLACHECDTPVCANPNHLFLGTVAMNNADMLLKGRQARGSVHGQAMRARGATHVRYGHADRRRVLDLRGRGLTLSAISAETGISKAHASRIVRGMLLEVPHGR